MGAAMASRLLAPKPQERHAFHGAAAYPSLKRGQPEKGTDLFSGKLLFLQGWKIQSVYCTKRRSI
jgi:hypothetical protein